MGEMKPMRLGGEERHKSPRELRRMAVEEPTRHLELDAETGGSLREALKDYRYALRHRTPPQVAVRLDNATEAERPDAEKEYDRVDRAVREVLRQMEPEPSPRASSAGKEAPGAPVPLPSGPAGTSPEWARLGERLEKDRELAAQVVSYVDDQVRRALKAGYEKANREWIVGWTEAFGGPEAVQAGSELSVPIPRTPADLRGVLRHLMQVAGADAGGPGPRLAALERRVRALEEAWRKDRKAS